MYELCRSVCIYTSFWGWRSAKDDKIFNAIKASISLFESSSARMLVRRKLVNDDALNVTWEFVASNEPKRVVISNVVVRRASKFFVASATWTNKHSSASRSVKGLVYMF